MNNYLKIVSLLCSSFSIWVIAHSKYPLVIIMGSITAIVLTVNALILN